MDRRELGILGEKKAAEYLHRLKYKIIHSNYRCRLGEIDIIAYKDGTYIFVEVKTRKNLAFGRPIEAINQNKRNHLLKVAQYYIQSFRLNHYNFRFDGIEVMVLPEKGIEIHHIKNIIG